MVAAKSEALSKPEGESVGSELPGQRYKGLRGFASVGDIGLSGSVQGCRGANDDEENDDHATDTAEEDVEPGLRIVAGANLLFDETGLQIEELPWCDGGADKRGEGDQIADVPMKAAGNKGHAGGQNPIGLGENRRKR